MGGGFDLSTLFPLPEMVNSSRDKRSCLGRSELISFYGEGSVREIHSFPDGVVNVIWASIYACERSGGNAGKGLALSTACLLAES